MNDRPSAGGGSVDEHTADDPPTYEWTDGVEPGVRIVEAVADATGRDPTTLPALQESVDVDAMNRILASGGNDRIHVTIEYAGHVVEVEASGTITVLP